MRKMTSIQWPTAGPIAAICPLARVGAAIAETTQQPSCRIGPVILGNGETQPVDRRATVASRGTTARIVAAEEVSFRTSVSSETRTLGDMGEVPWAIEFAKGQDVATAGGYAAGSAGPCDQPRVTN